MEGMLAQICDMILRFCFMAKKTDIMNEVFNFEVQNVIVTEVSMFKNVKNTYRTFVLINRHCNMAMFYIEIVSIYSMHHIRFINGYFFMLLAVLTLFRASLEGQHKSRLITWCLSIGIDLIVVNHLLPLDSNETLYIDLKKEQNNTRKLVTVKWENSLLITHEIT